MALTLREKDHWKDRITRKIDRAIEAILAAEGPGYMQEITVDAKQQAYKSLGLAEMNDELDELEQTRKELDKKVGEVVRKQLAIVRGKQVEDVEAVHMHHSRHSYLMHEVENAVKARQKLIEKELLERDETGRRILKLRHEKEELLDTVWLATSSSQIKELWGTVAAILNQEPTELQKEAMSIEPVEDA